MRDPIEGRGKRGHDRWLLIGLVCIQGASEHWAQLAPWVNIGLIDEDSDVQEKAELEGHIEGVRDLATAQHCARLVLSERLHSI